MLLCCGWCVVLLLITVERCWYVDVLICWFVKVLLCCWFVGLLLGCCVVVLVC